MTNTFLLRQHKQEYLNVPYMQSVQMFCLRTLLWRETLPPPNQKLHATHFNKKFDICPQVAKFQPTVLWIISSHFSAPLLLEFLALCCMPHTLTRAPREQDGEEGWRDGGGGVGCRAASTACTSQSQPCLSTFILPPFHCVCVVVVGDKSRCFHSPL